MNIAVIKSQIAKVQGIELPTLMMVRQFDEAKQPQPWLSHWDNTSRTRITMHEEVFNEIKANPQAEGYAFKSELVPAKGTPDTEGYRAAYHRFVVIKPLNVEATF